MTDSSANPLVQPLAAGDVAAFAALFERLGERLFRVAHAMLRDRSEAEDAVQDLFVNLARMRHQLVGVKNLDAYVFACLRNAVGQRARRIKADREGPRGIIAAPPPASCNVNDRHDELEAALRSLPAEQREVIALKIDGGLTFMQIAAVLKISANTAASRYRYALEKLRAALEP